MSWFSVMSKRTFSISLCRPSNAQPLVGVPPTNGWAFEGLQSEMEKVRFDITENQLIGYRAYDYAPGSQNPITGGTNNKDAPVISFKISGHFDVKREYNP